MLHEKKSRDSVPSNRLMLKALRSRYVPPLGFQECGLREMRNWQFSYGACAIGNEVAGNTYCITNLLSQDKNLPRGEFIK
jgi:hypothetical protein